MIKLRKISEEKTILEENLLIEKSLSKLHRIMLGLEHRIYSFGVMTPENPMRSQLTPAENNIRTKEFEGILKDGMFQYIPVKGQYEHPEHSYVILNISLDTLLNYGERFEQEAVIFARNTFDYVSYHYYDRTDKNKPFTTDKDKRHVDYYKDLPNADDFYSKLKGWKFSIPFPLFDEELKIVRPYKNKGGFPLSEYQINEINKINKKIVEENLSGRNAYGLRGHINGILGCGMNLDQFDGNKWSDHPYVPYLDRRSGMKYREHK